MSQLTNHLLMIEPIAFRYNEETAVNNYYQKHLDSISKDEVQARALSEFSTFVQKLRAKGIEVTVVQDTLYPDTPDSIFPNNWVSFHHDGRVALYPMYAVNRRTERRMDIMELLSSDKSLLITDVVDFTSFEADHIFLEGTGSMLLDREHKICYAALSLRTQKSALDKFCETFDYESVSFVSNQNVGNQRMPIYHTNVMMCIADKYAVVCMDTIDDKQERLLVEASFKSTGKEIIEITEEQKHRFAGNMLQVLGDQPYLVMSSSAYASLTSAQIKQIENYNPIIHSSLDTIESCGGGSARCMMAEVFLPSK